MNTFFQIRMLFERPPIYAISHILIGFIAAWYPTIGVIAIVYQLLQYILNIRFFPITLSWKHGNHIEHTSLKLFEIAIGYVIGTLIRKRESYL